MTYNKVTKSNLAMRRTQLFKRYKCLDYFPGGRHLIVTVFSCRNKESSNRWWSLHWAVISTSWNNSRIRGRRHGSGFKTRGRYRPPLQNISRWRTGAVRSQQTLIYYWYLTFFVLLHLANKKNTHGGKYLLCLLLMFLKLLLSTCSDSVAKA